MSAWFEFSTHSLNASKYFGSIIAGENPTKSNPSSFAFFTILALMVNNLFQLSLITKLNVAFVFLWIYFDTTTL